MVNHRQNSILIIIPAYNEEERIGKVLGDVDKYIRDTGIDADLLVIDDGSEDLTKDIAGKYSAEVISLPYNTGYGVALQTGFKYALESDYDYLIHMDADGQHESGSINFLLKEIQNGESDIIIGSRFLDNSHYPLALSKRIGIAIFRTVIKLVTKQNITDPTSGFQALDRKAFKFYSHIYPSDFPDANIIIISYFAGLKIKEIPVKIYPKIQGKSMHSGIKPFYYAFKIFLSILVTLLRKKSKV